MAQQGRPFLVWVIFLLLMFGSAAIVVSTVVALSGIIPPGIQTEMGMDAMRTIDYVVSLALTLIYFAAAVALIRMRKAALYLFVAAFCGEFGVLIWEIVDKSRAAVIMSDGDMSQFVSMISIAIAFFICVYTLKLALAERLQ